MPLLKPGNNDRSSSGEPEELRATWGEHLEELRIRLFRIAALLAVGLAIGWWLFPHVYTALDQMAKGSMPKTVEMEVVFHTFTDAFFLQLKLAFYTGLILTLPFTVLQIWGFVAPGLRPQERRPFKAIAPISILLFALGCYLCWVCMPITIGWFAEFTLNFPGTKIMQDPQVMIFFIVKMMLAFGLCFQMPLVVYFLTRVGILTTKGLMRYWRQAVFAIFLISALITPSGDPFTMTVLAAPMTLLFFGSMGAARWSEKKSGGVDVLDNLD